MRPMVFLRLEALVLGLVATGAYVAVGYNILLFLVLVILPDVSIAGYIAGPRIGSLVYNAIHMLTLPLALLVWGLWSGQTLSLAIGLAWLAHIGADRAMGLGLKYEDAPFRETHLQNI